ncbi:MAG: copper chaperone PCu(A)C [Pikeienuella sp.]
MIRLTITAAALAALAALTALPARAESFTLGDITVETPWARPNLPNRPTAAYAVITNSGTEPDRLIRASSPSFGLIELHATEMTEGVMRMLKLDAIDTPAGGQAVLAPRGLHLMLFNAAEAFTPGMSFPVSLTFERAGTMEIVVPVKRTAGGGHSHGDDHGHGSE